MKIIKISHKILNDAVLVLKGGGIVICPTDTVYGFLADAQNKKAVDKIFKIKKRPKSKPLSVFVKDIKMAKMLAEVSEEQERTLNKYWPGKYIFILKKNIDVGRIYNLYGVVYKKTIAIRIPKYKFLNDLLKKINKPLAQTSVNISAEPPMTKIQDIIYKFGNNKYIDLIIDGGDLKKALSAQTSKPSKIIDLSKGGIKTIRN